MMFSTPGEASPSLLPVLAWEEQRQLPRLHVVLWRYRNGRKHELELVLSRSNDDHYWILNKYIEKDVDAL